MIGASMVPQCKSCHSPISITSMYNQVRNKVDFLTEVVECAITKRTMMKYNAPHFLYARKKKSVRVPLEPFLIFISQYVC